MTKNDLIRLRSKIVASLARLDATIANARETLKQNAEVVPNFLQDESDAAKGELDANTIRELHNHSVVQRGFLRQALARMSEGTYGNCLWCEEEIDLARLEAMPSATLCVHCQSRREADFIRAPKMRTAIFQSRMFESDSIQVEEAA